MSEERPFVLILLTWLLRALNALFLVVCFPLHKLVSLTAPHVTKEEPDAAARVLRFVLSTLALLLLLSMLGTPPIVAWLLAPTEWLPPSLAAAAALFTVVYGFAVCEKGTKLYERKKAEHDRCGGRRAIEPASSCGAGGGPRLTSAVTQHADGSPRP